MHEEIEQYTGGDMDEDVDQMVTKNIVLVEKVIESKTEVGHGSVQTFGSPGAGIEAVLNFFPSQSLQMYRIVI